MGFLNWLQKRGLAGMIPRNAFDQYAKWKRRYPDMPEAEVAQSIFMLRYVVGKPILTNQEQKRLASYLSGDFEFSCLLDFCLASLDIEGHIDPLDGDAFTKTVPIIIEELERLGFQTSSEPLRSFMEVDNFTHKWVKKGGRGY